MKTAPVSCHQMMGTKLVSKRKDIVSVHTSFVYKQINISFRS